VSILIDAERLRALTPWPKLIDALQSAFREPCEVPERLHFDVSGVGSLIIMPAWHQNGFLGVKLVQVFPGNSSIGKPTVHGLYMLASASNGEVLSLIDAQELTARRTAATSALASRFLSRESSQCLLVMGTGRLAFEVISAHATVRPIDQVLIWGRNRERASSLSDRVNDTLTLHAQPIDSLDRAVLQADIISTVTTAIEPILSGRNLRPGTHVDLIGGYTPLMREADDDVMRSAKIYVDRVSSALREAGDIASPLERGIITKSAIRGDLFGLCTERAPKRSSEKDITVFKSVGLALEDLAAAALAWASTG
jgi:ornithine cyclodeaminase/alanine dehydrogenase-like protein (mu-crystallin family)